MASQPIVTSETKPKAKEEPSHSQGNSGFPETANGKSIVRRVANPNQVWSSSRKFSQNLFNEILDLEFVLVEPGEYIADHMSFTVILSGSIE